MHVHSIGFQICFVMWSSSSCGCSVVTFLIQTREDLTKLTRSLATLDRTHTSTVDAVLHTRSFVTLDLLIFGLLLLLTLTATPAAIKLPLRKCLPCCGYRTGFINKNISSLRSRTQRVCGDEKRRILLHYCWCECERGCGIYTFLMKTLILPWFNLLCIITQSWPCHLGCSYIITWNLT